MATVRDSIQTLVHLVLVGALLALLIFFTASRDIDRRNSSDGRYAPCEVITEHGVTEYLDTFEDRCN